MIIVSMSDESKEIIPILSPSEGGQTQLLHEVKRVKNNNMTKENRNTSLEMD